MDSVRETAIASLINTRSQALHISRVELVAGCGFKNIAKGIRRLEQVCAGDFCRAGFLLSRLPDALSVESHVVNAAVVATERAKLQEDDQRYRDTFRPHGIIICERSRPEPLFVVAIIGIASLLRIDFTTGSNPITFVDQVIKEVVNRLGRWNSPALPAFGRPVGFVVNYAFNRSIEFSVEGKPLFVCDRAIKLGDANLESTGRAISSEELDALFGSSKSSTN
jgi:hypothetical protein